MRISFNVLLVMWVSSLRITCPYHDSRFCVRTDLTGVTFAFTLMVSFFNSVFPCLSLSFLVFPCLSLSFLVFPCLSLSFLVFPCLSLSFLVFPCLSLSFLVFPCLSLSFLVFPCLSLSFLVFPCLSLSILDSIIAFPFRWYVNAVLLVFAVPNTHSHRPSQV